MPRTISSLAPSSRVRKKTVCTSTFQIRASPVFHVRSNKNTCTDNIYSASYPAITVSRNRWPFCPFILLVHLMTHGTNPSSPQQLCIPGLPYCLTKSLVSYDGSKLPAENLQQDICFSNYGFGCSYTVHLQRCGMELPASSALLCFSLMTTNLLCFEQKWDAYICR